MDIGRDGMVQMVSERERNEDEKEEYLRMKLFITFTVNTPDKGA